jgi:hypothetical protein
MKLIQIRNVPDDVHAALKERAARERTSMSDMLLGEVERLARRPSLDEMKERLAQRASVPQMDVDALVREDRETR